jgi:hypothetical protein
MTQAKRFETLEVAGGTKEIEALPVLETGTRPLTKLFPTEGGGKAN